MLCKKNFCSVTFLPRQLTDPLEIGDSSFETISSDDVYLPITCYSCWYWKWMFVTRIFKKKVALNSVQSQKIDEQRWNRLVRGIHAVQVCDNEPLSRLACLISLYGLGLNTHVHSVPATHAQDISFAYTRSWLAVPYLLIHNNLYCVDNWIWAPTQHAVERYFPLCNKNKVLTLTRSKTQLQPTAWAQSYLQCA